MQLKCSGGYNTFWEEGLEKLENVETQIDCFKKSFKSSAKLDFKSAEVFFVVSLTKQLKNS